jgi:uncharacterized protein
MLRPSRCPVCRRQLPVLDADAPHRPFCSPRCQSIDLGSWLTEHYRISRPIEEEDLDGGPPRAEGDGSG